MLRDIVEDKVGRDRCHLIEARLTEFALDIIFAGKAETAMKLDAGIGRFP